MADRQSELVVTGRTSRLLSPEALDFVAGLEQRFGDRRRTLLAARQKKTSWDFLPETLGVRTGTWKVAPVPEVLLDRRVEITGPAEPKMIINALNSGANVFMADLEDSLSPTWAGVIGGQEALYEAVRRTLSFVSPEGKPYQLAERTALLFVRPRGWALEEAHVRYHDRAMSGSLFDFGMYFFHNAAELLKRGVGPFFYLPKMESHLEARLWNDVFVHAEATLGLRPGSIRATVLIETLPAAFEMDEILYELREHSAGLNCGRWDYIFSFIKKQPDSLLPDRSALTMDKGFLRAYTQLLIQTCHRRGAFAMGGMAAQIPIRNDAAAHAAALAKVSADKLREVRAGHDGTWIAHPGLAPAALEAFNAGMTGPNQLGVLRPDVDVNVNARAVDLLRAIDGQPTDAGLRLNIRVGIQYLESWLGGQGCVPLYNLMEDAATAEISRAQLWQWIRHGARTSDGRPVTEARFDQALGEEIERIHDELGARRIQAGVFPTAARLFSGLVKDEAFEEFLTLPAYELLP